MPPRPENAAPPPSEPRPRVFLSYGRRDAAALAERLRADLERRGFAVWQDVREIRAGQAWEEEIQAGLRGTQVVLALLSPHAVRRAGGPAGGDTDGVCLDELAFARFGQPPTPILPVMAVACEPPFSLFRLDHVDLTRAAESEDAYRRGLERIVAGLEALLRGEPAVVRSGPAAPRALDFAGFLNDKRKDFTGRGWLFAEIDAWRSADQERALLLIGDPGVGKSAVVAQLVHLNPAGQILAYHCCRADVPDTVRAATFVRGVSAMLASRLPEYAAQLDLLDLAAVLDEKPTAAFEKLVLEPLERIADPGRGVCYLLIDALDESLAVRRRADDDKKPAGPDRPPVSCTAAKVTIVDLLATRLDRLPAWLRVVATTRNDPAVLRRLGGLRARLLDANDPRSVADLDLFIDRRLATPALASRLAASGLSAAEARAGLCQASGGNFLYVRQFLQGVERDLHGFGRPEVLPRGLSGIYASFFARPFPTPKAFARARAVLQVMAAAQEALTPGLIAQATGLDEEEELFAVLEKLAPFLVERDGRVSLYHKSLADWLTNQAEAGEFYASRRKGHERLAELCWREYRRGPGRMAPYAIHLPAHLAECAMWDRLEAALTDLAFIEAKVAADDTSEAGLSINADFKRAVQVLPTAGPALAAIGEMANGPCLIAVSLALELATERMAELEEQGIALFYRAFGERFVRHCREKLDKHLPSRREPPP